MKTNRNLIENVLFYPMKHFGNKNFNSLMQILNGQLSTPTIEINYYNNFFPSYSDLNVENDQFYENLEGGSSQSNNFFDRH